MCAGSNYRQGSQKGLTKKVTFEEGPEESEGGAIVSPEEGERGGSLGEKHFRKREEKVQRPSIQEVHSLRRKNLSLLEPR